MSELFAESHVKLHRARKHLSELESLWAAHEIAHPPRVDFQSNRTPEGLAQPTELKVAFASPPVEFSAIVGDVVHNLRSALDLMAVELAGGGRKVHFPFANSASDLTATIKLRGLDKAGPEVTEAIRNLRPYNGGNELLRALHDLDIADKHRKLIPNNLICTTPPISANMIDGRIVFQLGEGGASSMPSFPAGWPLAERAIMPALCEMIEMVADILTQFATLPTLANRT